MSVKLVVDMNLSPEWVPELVRQGWDAVHWSAVGDPRAPEKDIMAWALANGRIVFTHDFDFATMLAMTHATGPSVFQVRGTNVMPEDIGGKVALVLRNYAAELSAGALVILDEKKSRVRVLPL